MIRTEGFVDLRVSPSGQLATNEDSVWPSFTDVMTVIVMIFLLALVVIPELRISDLGLVDVTKFELTELFEEP